jgi:hypothetical protein
VSGETTRRRVVYSMAGNTARFDGGEDWEWIDVTVWQAWRIASLLGVPFEVQKESPDER